MSLKLIILQKTYYRVIGVSKMNKNILLFDGAMGTMLLKNVIKNNESCEIFGFNNKEIVLDIHKSYLEAGCDIITTLKGLAGFTATQHSWHCWVS